MVFNNMKFLNLDLKIAMHEKSRGNIQTHQGLINKIKIDGKNEVRKFITQPFLLSFR